MKAVLTVKTGPTQAISINDVGWLRDSRDVWSGMETPEASDYEGKRWASGG